MFKGQLPDDINLARELPPYLEGHSTQQSTCSIWLKPAADLLRSSFWLMIKQLDKRGMFSPSAGCVCHIFETSGFGDLSFIQSSIQQTCMKYVFFARCYTRHWGIKEECIPFYQKIHNPLCMQGSGEGR